MPEQLPTDSILTVLAFDFGTFKMGIAIGNTLTQTARPLCQFPMDNGKPDWQALLAIVQEWQAQQIIVGLPLNMDDSESELALRSRKFARRLNHQLKEYKIP